MAIAAVTYSFTTATTAVAAQVNQDFTDVVTFLNSNVVHVDGSKTMTGQLALLAADPTTANQAARKSYVDQFGKWKGKASDAGETGIFNAPPATDVGVFFKSGYNGTRTTDANSNISVNFATAFPNAVIFCHAEIYAPSLIAGNANISALGVNTVVTSANLSSFSFRVSTQAGANVAAQSVAYNWFALGY